MSGNTIQAAPMLRILLPLMAGIATGSVPGFPRWIAPVLLVVLFCLAIVLRNKKYRSAILYSCIMCFGITVFQAHLTHRTLPEGKHRIEMRITERVSRISERTCRTEAFVGAWCDSTGTWHTCREKITVYADTSLHIGLGDAIICQAYISPITDSTGSYARYMNSLGFFSSAYIPPSSQMVYSAEKKLSLKRFSAGLQSAAAGRLSELGMTDDQTAICTAMATGCRSSLDKSLRKAYSDTGTAHLLAVSGLHVGIVFILINALLYLLPLFRYGHIVKNIAAMAAVWGFVVMTGMSWPAIRAAIMFSMLQLSLASGSAYNSFNALCAAAVIMLSANPVLLFDTGFQMSFIAVGAIILWFVPIMNLLKCRWKILDMVWGTIIIGTIASISLAPIIAYRFGQVPLLGILLNVPIILSAHVIVLFSLMWIILPIPVFAPMIKYILSLAAGFQNKIIETGASFEHSHIHTDIPLWGIMAIYALLIILTVIMQSKQNREKPFSLT